MPTNRPIETEDAKSALDAVNKMHRAGHRLAVTPRWLNAGFALSVTAVFAINALSNPVIYKLFLAIGVAFLLIIGRKKTGAYIRDWPQTRAGWLKAIAIVALLLTLFFGGMAAHRAYDIAWLPFATAAIAGLFTFLFGEIDRLRSLLKSSDRATG